MSLFKSIFFGLAAVIVLGSACRYDSSDSKNDSSTSTSLQETVSGLREMAAIIPGIEAALALTGRNDEGQLTAVQSIIGTPLASIDTAASGIEGINGRTPGEIQVLASSVGRFPANENRFIENNWGIPRSRTFLILEGPDNGGWHRVEQKIYYDLDFALERVEYEYYVKNDDNTWAIYGAKEASAKYRYVSWQEFYRDGSRITRTITGTSADVDTQHAYTIGALILPENDLEAYRFSGDPDDPSLAPPFGTPVYSVTSAITRTKTDSTRGGKAITGVEYYAESNGGNSTQITASTLSYTLEAARSGDPTAIRTVIRSEKELVRDASGLWQTALSKSVGLSASGNPNSNWNVTIVNVVKNPKVDRPADKPFYESVESIWRGSSAANIDLVAQYPTSNHQFLIALNPSAGGGFSGQLYDRRSAGGAYQVSDVTVIGGVVSITRAGRANDYPGVYSRRWRDDVSGPPVVFSSQGATETVEINVAALDSIQIKVPSGTATFSGKYASHEFIGTYALDGVSIEVLITTGGAYMHYGTADEQFVAWE